METCTLLACAAALLGAPADAEPVWHETLPAARAQAAESGRPILIYFWLEGSAFCEQMYADTLTTPEGAAELALFECVGIEARAAAASALLARFNVSALPTIVFANAAGEAEDAIRGAMALDGFLAEAQRVRRGENTVTDWRARAAAAPDDLAVRLRLALQLEHVGEVEEGARLEASILADDPEGETVAGAQLWLYEVFAEVRNAAADASDPSTYELAPLYAHLAGVKPEPVLFEGWKWITDVERQRGERGKERAAWVNAWRYAPAGEVRAETGVRTLHLFLELYVELEPAERALGQRIAREVEADLGGAPPQQRKGYVHHLRALGLALGGDLAAARVEAGKALEASPERPEHSRLIELLDAVRGE